LTVHPTSRATWSRIPDIKTYFHFTSTANDRLWKYFYHTINQDKLWNNPILAHCFAFLIRLKNKKQTK